MKVNIWHSSCPFTGVLFNNLQKMSQAQVLITDPKIFLVKCQAEKEQEAVLALMKQHETNPFPITSAFCFPRSHHGSIFVEAFKEYEVKQAIGSQALLSVTAIKLVPLCEMIKLFE